MLSCGVCNTQIGKSSETVERNPLKTCTDFTFGYKKMQLLSILIVRLRRNWLVLCLTLTFILFLVIDTLVVSKNKACWYIRDSLYCYSKINCINTKCQFVCFVCKTFQSNLILEHITTVGDHIVYASNTSSSWKNGTVLHKGKALPAEVNFFTVFRYLTFEPLHLPQQPFVILELCEIGVIGEFFLYLNKTVGFEDVYILNA